MSKREPDTPNWQPFSIRRLLRMVSGLVFVDETHELEEADDGEPIIARAERRIDALLAERRETRPASYDPIGDNDPLIADIAIIMIRYKELARLEEKLIRALGRPCTVHRWNKKTGKRRTRVWPTITATINIAVPGTEAHRREPRHRWAKAADYGAFPEPKPQGFENVIE